MKILPSFADPQLVLTKGL